MTLEAILEKFDLFADAPDAVREVRKLVLQLAVQGKLVEQDPSEGDACALLEAIVEERNKNGQGRTTEETESVELQGSERWHEVPSSWRWVHLGTVGKIVGGGTPRSDNPAYFAYEGIPWLTPADLNGYKEKRIFRGRRCITKVGLENSSAQLLPEGSVLFSSRAPIGYVVIAGTELATNQGFKSCVPFILETNEFLYYVLRNAGARIDREASGTTFREVSGKIVAQIPVPLPPLAEQKRIVAKVDELMALCDRLESLQQERDSRHVALARASLSRFAEAPTPAHLGFLFHNSYTITPVDTRKAVLALAVQGKLVPQDPNDEPARVLLERIHAEKAQLVRDGVLKRVEQMSNERESAPPFGLPDGWEFAPLSEFCTSITDGDHLPPPKTESGIPFLVISNVRWGGIDFSDTRYVSEEYFGKLDPIRKPRKGDILYTLVGSFGIPVMVNVEQPFCVQRHIGILRPSSEVSLTYLVYLLASEFVMEQSSRIATGIAQKTVPLGGLRRISVPLPPIAEQRRIVAKVDQLMALVDQLETQLATSRATAEKLMEAVVAELTTQD